MYSTYYHGDRLEEVQESTEEGGAVIKRILSSFVSLDTEDRGALKTESVSREGLRGAGPTGIGV